MYLETDAKGRTRQLTFENLMKILEFYYPHSCGQMEQEMRWDGKKVTTGCTNPDNFKVYEYIKGGDHADTD
jgi:hypothetical protein